MPVNQYGRVRLTLLSDTIKELVEILKDANERYKIDLDVLHDTSVTESAQIAQLHKRTKANNELIELFEMASS